MKIATAIIIMLLIPSISRAQTRVSGSQQHIPECNAVLTSQPVKIDRPMKIDSVSGFHNGFWIVRNSKAEKAFWTERFAKSAIGYELRPGTYTVYPNLKQDIDTASVTIWLIKK